MQPSQTQITKTSGTALILFAVAVPCLIPLNWTVLGLAALSGSLLTCWKTGDRVFFRRMSVLSGAVLLLGFTDINTNLENTNFIVLGASFLAVILVPYLVLKRTDPGVITYRWLPKRFRWLDVIYVLISIPLAFAVVKLYFHVNPWMPTHWSLPAKQSVEHVWRLFVGINCVGIWDELFFVNTTFAVLRSVFPYRWANAGQSVVYASVLYDMAFTGLGVLIVPIFAWTQGAMFESSEGLIWVVLVHLIVDFFLFTAIVQYHYPGFSLGFH